LKFVRNEIEEAILRELWREAGKESKSMTTTLPQTLKTKLA
jgi:hypothetical protein